MPASAAGVPSIGSNDLHVTFFLAQSRCRFHQTAMGRFCAYLRRLQATNSWNVIRELNMPSIAASISATVDVFDILRTDAFKDVAKQIAVRKRWHCCRLPASKARVKHRSQQDTRMAIANFFHLLFHYHVCAHTSCVSIQTQTNPRFTTPFACLYLKIAFGYVVRVEPCALSFKKSLEHP
jgi:hypothetical protein